MNKEPIKSQKEADEVFNNLVKVTMEVMQVDREQASKRVNALLDSGILNGGDAGNTITQLQIDRFLQKQID